MLVEPSRRDIPSIGLSGYQAHFSASEILSHAIVELDSTDSTDAPSVLGHHAAFRAGVLNFWMADNTPTIYERPPGTRDLSRKSQFTQSSMFSSIEN